MKAGYEVQQKSIVLLKNKDSVLPLAKGRTVYIPKRFIPASKDWFGNITPEKLEYPVNMELVKKYFNVTDDPAKADLALVFVKGPVAEQDMIRPTGKRAMVMCPYRYNMAPIQLSMQGLKV